jgi:hypothetical protein
MNSDDVTMGLLFFEFDKTEVESFPWRNENEEERTSGLLVLFQ